MDVIYTRIEQIIDGVAQDGDIYVAEDNVVAEREGPCDGFDLPTTNQIEILSKDF